MFLLCRQSSVAEKTANLRLPLISIVKHYTNINGPECIRTCNSWCSERTAMTGRPDLDKCQQNKRCNWNQRNIVRRGCKMQRSRKKETTARKKKTLLLRPAQHWSRIGRNVTLNQVAALTDESWYKKEPRALKQSHLKVVCVFRLVHRLLVKFFR